MSARLAEGTDILSRRYHVSMTGAHTLAAQASLGILLHLDENINSEGLEKFPLAKYAAEHWVDHVQLEDVSQRVEDGLKQLFDPRKPHLAIWLQVHDPASWLRSPQYNGTCLHYAGLCGLHRIIEFLVTEHRQEVNTLGFLDRSTPLHVAVQGRYSGAASATRVLLKFGADAMAGTSMGALHCMRRRGPRPHKPWRSYERLWKRAQMRRPRTSMGAIHCMRRRGPRPHKPRRSYERLWKRAQMRRPRTSMGAIHCIRRRGGPHKP
jgi:uncharacterized membrane protein